MKIHFVIQYDTRFGQNLYISGASTGLGEWRISEAKRMIYRSPGKWVLTQQISPQEVATGFEYKYLVRDDSTNQILWEGGINRIIRIDDRVVKEVVQQDSWQEISWYDDVLMRSAFTRTIFHRKRPQKGKKNDAKSNFRFQIAVPRVLPEHRIGIIGSALELGHWETRAVIPLDDHDYPNWSVDFSLKTDSFPLEYKYVILEAQSKKIVQWESGPNRTLALDSFFSPNIKTIRRDEHFRYQAGSWRGAGVSVPVFSLVSRKSLGCGEFSDIKLLVDWAFEAGLQLIQTLPVNDTVNTHTWVDSYPYSAISVYALHPMYLRIESMVTSLPETLKKRIHQERKRLNRATEIDYEAVMATKITLARAVFDLEKEEFLKQPSFQVFFKENANWLKPYALFCYFRDTYKTTDYTQWGDDQEIDNQVFETLTSPESEHFDTIAYHYFVQFHLHQQLLEAAQYARTKGIVLKGDIPIGVNRFSVDTWMQPHLFHLDKQAGAPPDDFSSIGQNWRFPTYHWEEMEKDNYAWWQSRLKHMSEIFDAFRIDHILGFFRIWEIPEHAVQGILGRFYPALPLTQNELHQRGFEFDVDRLSQQSITKEGLDHLFDEASEKIRDEFFIETSPDQFSLKDEFHTQKQIRSYFTQAEKSVFENPEHLESILFHLAADQIFLKDESRGREEFHPRIDLQKCLSFERFTPPLQSQLVDLHNDFFYRRHEAFWQDQGFKKLPAIKNATDMLICGEDLGMVPKCVPQVMQALKLLSLRVQRMPLVEHQLFDNPAEYPYLSVCTPSTHDMSTIREWWEENRETSQIFFNQELALPGEAPSICETSICRAIIEQHLNSPSMWAIFQIQDLLAMDGAIRRDNPEKERVNVPSIQQYYWRYKLHFPLEDLLKQFQFNQRLRSMIVDSRRATSY